MFAHSTKKRSGTYRLAGGSAASCANRTSARSESASTTKSLIATLASTTHASDGTLIDRDPRAGESHCQAPRRRPGGKNAGGGCSPESVLVAARLLLGRCAAGR